MKDKIKRGYKLRFESWLKALDGWCRKHKVTRKQAVSILFFDYISEPTNNAKEIQGWVEANDFANRIFYEGKEIRHEFNI